MKANELMIGDWVYTEHDPTPRQIDWIRTGEVGLFWNEVVTPPYLVPIPLTSEILEKNGWRSMMNGTGEFYLKKPLVDAAIVTKNIIGFQMNHGPFNGLSIHYVHELQHALRLCGIKHEITL